MRPIIGAATDWSGTRSEADRPEAVKPFVRRARRTTRPTRRDLHRGIPTRGEICAHQDPGAAGRTLALHTARTLLVKQKTMLANTMRGLATEFGLTMPKASELDELMAQVDADETLPEDARQASKELYDHCGDIFECIEALETKIVYHARHDETARRIATIPGVGPITASLIVATVADIGAFKTARHFAAWLGLVPRQYSTGGKTRLGRITKTGNSEIRKSLVLGATVMVRYAGQWNSSAGAWFRDVLERRPVRLATVALANKMARIAWALMTRKEVYHAKGRVAAAAEQRRDARRGTVGGGREPV